MFLHQRFVPGLAIASYLVGDEQSGQAAVIDPTRDVDEYLRVAAQQKLRIEHILETHVHADYVSGALELKAALSGDSTELVEVKPQIHCSREGGDAWLARYADHAVRDGDSIDLGSLRLTAIHTPGHTPEHVAWALFDRSRSDQFPWLIFTGDSLFVGDVGRPDLLGETERRTLAHQLYQTLFDKFSAFADFTEVFPGHGAGSLCGKAIASRRSSTIGFEKHFNVSLQPLPEDQWTQRLLRDMPPAPPYFARMKKLNVTGPKLLAQCAAARTPIDVDQLQQKWREKCVVLDVRSPEAFAAAHIPGAINIGLSPNLATWAGWVLPYDQPIAIVANDRADAPDVITQLLRVGFDNLCGYLDDSFDALRDRRFEVAKLETISVQELAKQLSSNSSPIVLDVRTDSEFNSGHIAGAHHIHAGMVRERANELPTDRQIAVTCGSGYRASLAASLLKRAGRERVANVLGGMTAWKDAKLPVLK